MENLNNGTHSESIHTSPSASTTSSVSPSLFSPMLHTSGDKATTGVSTLVIVGPTASGKTSRAVSLARHFSGEIISADSRQLYRGMTIGTGKDLEEYQEIPYHLIDVAPAGYKYNLFQWLRDANVAAEIIRKNGHMPVVCGGTGMYVEAFLNGLELPQVPENPSLRKSLEGKSLQELTQILSSMKTLHNITDVDTPKRAIRAIEIQTYYQEHPQAATKAEPHPIEGALVIGVDIDRDSRRTRIEKRLRQRLEEGMIEEVRGLLDSGIPAQDLIYYGLEYKFLTQHVIGELTYGQMYDQLLIAIHQFAKRQMTWFRGMEKRGHHINWIPYDLSEADFVARVEELVEKYPGL